MLDLALKSLIAYLLGAALGSLVLGRLRGIDIRNMGSGNAGATNALRTQGKAFGLAVLVFDIGKALLAVVWLPTLHLAEVGPNPDVSRQCLALACGIAVILGHIYPVWFGFRGGKGVATVVGVIAGLEPHLLGPLLLCWLVVVLITGYVGLASMLAGVGLVTAACWVEPANMALLEFCIFIAALVIYTHRGNIARMAAGTEPRARRLWLFRSRAVR